MSIECDYSIWTACLSITCFINAKNIKVDENLKKAITDSCHMHGQISGT
jgi:hypothetical protein